MTVMVAALAGACSSGVGAPPDDWSRSYLASRESVFEAALDALEASDFYIETVDGDQGRIRANSSARRGDDLTLIVDVEERSTGVRVDVMAQDPSAREGASPGRMSAVVAEFLRNLDGRMERERD